MRPFITPNLSQNAAGAAAACCLNSSTLNPAVAAVLAPGKAFEDSLLPSGRIVGVSEDPGFRVKEG